MRYSKWVDKYDQTRTSAEVIADSFSFIGGQNRQGNEQNYDQTNSLVADPLPAQLSTRTEARRAKVVAIPAEEVVLTTDANDDLPF
jgi:single-strand DNA-binding protein